MIYDCFSYWDEDLLLDLRLNILDNYVDHFVIVEWNKTRRLNTLKFIKSVSEKNYSEADKYLKQIVDNKLVQKMSKFKDTEI